MDPNKDKILNKDKSSETPDIFSYIPTTNNNNSNRNNRFDNILFSDGFNYIYIKYKKKMHILFSKNKSYGSKSRKYIKKKKK